MSRRLAAAIRARGGRILNIKTFWLYLFFGFGIILVNIVICTTSAQFFLTACTIFKAKLRVDKQHSTC